MTDHNKQPLFTVSEAINKGFELTQKNWTRYLVLMIGAVIGFGTLNIVGTIIFGTSDFGQFILQVLSLILSTIITIGFIRYALNVLDGKATDLKILLKLDWRIILSVAVFSLLYACGVVLGLIFIIVPGIILAVGWHFGQYLIIDKKTDLLASFGLSWKITAGHRGRIFLFLLAIGLPVIALTLIVVTAAAGTILGSNLLVATFVGAVLLLVVAVIAQMVGSFGLAYIYRKLAAKHHASS